MAKAKQVQTFEEIKAIVTDRDVSNFFHEDYKQYVTYVIENRAIPSLIDGLKPSYRKTLHACLKVMGSGKVIPGLEIVGSVYSNSAYHHGNASLEDVIVGSSSTYDNNAAPLKCHGSGGSLTTPSASAIRYLKFSLGNMAEVFKNDLDILEYNYDGDKQIEPTFYLPTVPLVLAKRTGAPAIGYSFSNDMSYSIPSLVDACLQQLKNIKNDNPGKGPLPKLVPYVDGFEGSYKELEYHKWQTSSIWTSDKTKVYVKGLPISVSKDAFRMNLGKLLDAGTILNYDNDKPTEFVIHFNASALAEHIAKGRLAKLLKLTDTTKTPGLNVINEKGRIETKLMTPHDVIRYFVGYRLTRYDDRKTLLIKKIDDRIDVASNLAKFIKLVVDGKLELRNIPIEVIKNRLVQENIEQSVLSVRISKLTKEEYEELLKEIETLKAERQYLVDTTTETMYINDLNKLKKDTAWQKSECPIESWVPLAVQK